MNKLLNRVSTIMIVGLSLCGCDPVYGGVHNYYPGTIQVKLDTNDTQVPDIIPLSADQGFAYRKPTKMRGITITTADGRTIKYDSAVIDKIVSDIHEPNERISWALTPQGLFADCVEYSLLVECRKRGEPPSQWKERP